MVAHTIITPVPVRNDKIVHDVLVAGDKMVYAIYSDKAFNLTIDIAFGDLKVELRDVGKNTTD